MRILMAMLIGMQLIASALLATRWLRARAAARRCGGVSGRSGCGRCLYPLGEWTSPICPECGADVHAVGVCTGQPWSRELMLVCVLFATLPVFAVLSPLAASWLLTTGVDQTSTQVEVNNEFLTAVRTESGAEDFSVVLVVTGKLEWRRLPPMRRRTTEIHVSYRLHSPGALRRAGDHPERVGELRSKSMGGSLVRLPDGTSPPTADALSALLKPALPPSAPPRWADEIARELPHALAVLWAGSSATRPPDLSAWRASSNPPSPAAPPLVRLWLRGISHGSTTHTPAWAPVLLLCAAAFMSVAAGVVVVRMIPLDRRPAQMGEWSAARPGAMPEC